MAYYQFESEWVLAAPIEKVFDAMLRYHDYSSWWSSIKKARLIESGGEDHLGARASYRVKSPLFYSMRFDVKITAIEIPHMIRISSTGDAAGVGNCTFEKRNGATRVLYQWDVSTTRAWMNALAPVARPIFVWAYHSVMREGGAGLARHLGGRLISCSSRVRQDRVRPESAASGVS